MKAAVYYETGGPEVLRYEDVPDPSLHRRGVVIEVKAISIEGGDALNRAGGPMPSTPHIVGYQCAGVIREVGESVEDRQPGQRVVTIISSGSHAELASAPSGSTWVLPGNLGFDEAVCIPVPFGTADDCLFEFGHLQEGETVLIQAGASGVGIAATQLAKRAGATVLATASSDEKLERLKEFGLDHGINYTKQDFVAAAQELTEGKGVDLVVDSVGGRTLENSIKALRYRGRAITVGFAGRDDEKPDPRLLLMGSKSLTGVLFAAEMGYARERTKTLVQRLLQEVADGKLRVVVDKTFPLAEAAQAHAYLESRQVFGRVVMHP
ncbi:MAG: zinc-binding dehydrogenase [Dehalococcoidia bacterium]|nr:zinc-binding dehydrogenase [Dehalococcoidia bacterium]